MAWSVNLEPDHDIDPNLLFAFKLVMDLSIVMVIPALINLSMGN